jgi:hypothetical protein
MDDESRYIFTLRNKRNGSSETFVSTSYSVVIEKGFGFMKKEMKFMAGK